MKLAFSLFLFAAFAFGQTTHYKATINWDDPFNPPGVTYKLDRADNSDCTGNPTFVGKASGIIPRTYTDEPLTPGKYCWRVTATVSGADSTANPTKDGTVPAFAPSNIQLQIQLTITSP